MLVRKLSGLRQIQYRLWLHDRALPCARLQTVASDIRAANWLIIMVRRFLCNRDEVPFDAMRQVRLAGDEKVCVINAGGMFFACEARCPHEGLPLCEGCLDGTTLTCLEHLWQWDLRDGSPVGPAEKPLAMREVEVDADAIYLVG